MKITLQIDYHTQWGQTIWVCGSTSSLGNWNEEKAIKMSYVSPSKWSLEFDTNDECIEYYYLVKENSYTIDKEWGEPHTLILDKNKSVFVDDIWKSIPQQKFLYTSGFSESFFFHEVKRKIKFYKKTILINVFCPYINKDQSLVLCGASNTLGAWDIKNAIILDPVRYGNWQTTINASSIKSSEEYKLAIYDNNTQEIVYWEEGENRKLTPIASNEKGDIVQVSSIVFRHSWMDWKAAGVAIPVFSLKSEDSFGVGEFSDLKKMVDWATITGQKMIQILPINDTTITYSWVDSYPYNAISIYALHPIYLGLKAYPLKDKDLYKKYKEEAATLNQLESVDYDKVLALKIAYLKDLYNEVGSEVLGSKDYLDFYKKNEEWLFPYACFCHLRDKYKTANYSQWKTHSVFNKAKLKKFAATKAVAEEINLVCFIQYLLHKQLVEVKEYAHQHNVVLKGDIPIGISRNSVEAWVEPHLFNLDVQTGAPPDDFSFFGQNWGFPTYNWDEMAKDGYQWWVKRFKKMADYFDAYRIDHILGFFRIWEIPLSSVQGLLGYFSPALPMSADEIRSYGVWFDENRMLNHYIHEHFLGNIFGEYTQEVIDKYLEPIEWQRFKLKAEYDTQLKIKEHLGNDLNEKNRLIRDGLYGLCNEVLFIRDKRNPDKFHPRITAQYSYSYQDLDQGTKDAYNRLYNDFFFRRHSQFWRHEAMQKLPALIASTSMLVCGEDLGMVPASVPSVMHELQILSLEIERMPKDPSVPFNQLQHLPYLSVCTTSTHDMSPIRLWWKEDRTVTQKYYNEVLWKHGAAPEECTADICWQIVVNHLNSPAMLTILPLQDWLSINNEIRRDNPEEERINVPAIAQHYWRYRMHLTLEDLINNTEYNKQVRSIIESSGRK